MSNPAEILIADDDPDQVKQLQLVLTAAGYRVRAARSQAETEELLLMGAPDLAILDLMMEQRDSGFVLSHFIKRLFPQVPVILLTAVTAETGIDFGTGGSSWIKADRVLHKPVRPEQLRQVVAQLLVATPHPAASDPTG
jgi:CheY-like chemotaxis protein